MNGKYAVDRRDRGKNDKQESLRIVRIGMLQELIEKRHYGKMARKVKRPRSRTP